MVIQWVQPMASIHAIDGKIGEVEDFIIDDTSWKVEYLIVDTGHWFPGNKVIISTQLFKDIEWGTSEVMITVTEEDVKNSPQYNPGEAIDESYEANLQHYYRKSMAEIY